VGLIAVDKAWEIYVGGNGGVKVRVAELLCTVDDEDEALEIIAAFLQLYRREANYNERTSVWCEQVGMDYIRRAVVDNVETRKELAADMRRALDSRSDPWRDRVESLESGSQEFTREFAPLRVKGLVVA
jgi:nitrite reductase (NADH) large subunit